MPARYQKGISPYRRQGEREVEAFKQNVRYSNLARYMFHIQETYGPNHAHRYTERYLYNTLKAARMLTKDGEVREDRLEKWARSRGYKAALPKSSQAWGAVTEGESP